MSCKILAKFTESVALTDHLALSDRRDGGHDTQARIFDAASGLVASRDVDGAVADHLPYDDREAARYLAARALEIEAAPTDAAYDRVYRAWGDIARDYPLAYVRVRDPADGGLYEYLVGGYPTLDACIAAVDGEGCVDEYDIVGVCEGRTIVAGGQAAQCRIDGRWALVGGRTVPLVEAEAEMREIGQPEAPVFRGWGPDAVDTGSRMYARGIRYGLVSDIAGQYGTVCEASTDPEEIRYTAAELADRGYDGDARIMPLRSDEDTGDRIYLRR